MKPLQFVFIIGLFFFIYGSINYYIGLRGWQAFGGVFIYRRFYWIVFWFIACGFILARLGERFIGSFGGKYLSLIGGYWLAAMYYLFFILLFIDGLRVLNKWLNIIPGLKSYNPTVTGAIILGMVFLLLIYGTWNARHTVINHYEVDINKGSNNLTGLKIAMVSDIHLGRIVDNKRLLEMVEKINELNPDVVLFAGDIVDEDVNVFVEEKMTETLKLLTPKYGSFAALGNHEYIGGHAEDIVRHLEEAGVHVLRDSWAKVADSVYIVGRDEQSRHNFAGGRRKPLEEVLADVDKSLPIILLDHQPRDLDQGVKAGVDLQFSGHTHRGQFFPNNLVTDRIFEVDWGYLKKENLQVIVSSGFGTWGPPIRIGNKSEIVEVFVSFFKGK
ncbi:MAG: metallophosphoesterase [Bacillota bacterium]